MTLNKSISGKHQLLEMWATPHKSFTWVQVNCDRRLKDVPARFKLQKAFQLICQAPVYANPVSSLMTCEKDLINSAICSSYLKFLHSSQSKVGS